MITTQQQEVRVELKFPIDDVLASEVRAWARENLGGDPYAIHGGDCYQIHSLYFDTPDRDIAKRTGKIGRTKFRVRCYGDEADVWLESKRKRREVVRKSRTRVEAGTFDQHYTRITSLEQLGEQPNERLDGPWSGDWFVERLQRRGLIPMVNLNYRRFVRTSLIDGRHHRLTIDDEIRSEPATDHRTRRIGPDVRPLTGQQVLELKFDGALPPLFKRLLMTFPLRGAGFSKYGQACDWIWEQPVLRHCG